MLADSQNLVKIFSFTAAGVGYGDLIHPWSQFGGRSNLNNIVSTFIDIIVLITLHLTLVAVSNTTFGAISVKILEFLPLFVLFKQVKYPES